MASKDAAFYEFLHRLVNMTGHFIHANAAVISFRVNTELTNPVKLSPLFDLPLALPSQGVIL